MNRPQRILIAIFVTIVAGAMSAFNTVVKNNRDYQEHPVASIIGSVIVSPLAGIIFYWGTGWLAKRKERKSNEALNFRSTGADDKFYDQVARELQEKPMIPGLWTKAFAEMGGDDSKARALYIKYRVANLKEEEQSSRIKANREEEENRATMKAKLMTICKKCGYAGCMESASFFRKGERGFIATACRCPKCYDRFDWYYVPPKDFEKAPIT